MSCSECERPCLYETYCDWEADVMSLSDDIHAAMVDLGVIERTLLFAREQRLLAEAERRGEQRAAERKERG